MFVLGNCQETYNVAKDSISEPTSCRGAYNTLFPRGDGSEIKLKHLEFSS
jgi:hypothetical protein